MCWSTLGCRGAFHLLCCSSSVCAANHPQRTRLSLLLEELVSSLAGLSLVCVRQKQPPFIWLTESCLPNHSLIGSVLTTPRLVPAPLTGPLYSHKVIPGQVGNGDRVLRRENDSHFHALLHLCQSKWSKIVALNCLFLSSTLIWRIILCLRGKRSERTAQTQANTNRSSCWAPEAYRHYCYFFLVIFFASSVARPQHWLRCVPLFLPLKFDW